MILSRSPYYKNVPWLRPSDGQQADSYKLELFIWEGELADAPLFATYSVEKQNIENSSGTDQIDIARLVEDYIPTESIQSASTGLQNGNCTVWVKSQIKYTVGLNITNELVSTDFATSGYAYGFEGENFEPSQIILSDSTEIDYDKSKVVNIPILQSQAETITVTALPSNTTLLSTSTIDATDTAEKVAILTIDLSGLVEDDCVLVEIGGESLTIFVSQELKYNPQNVEFINRYGGSQTITFSQERTDSLSSSGSVFETSSKQPNLGIHQFKKYNINGQSSFTLRSGYVGELQNHIYKELILTEKAWINGNPVNVDVTDVQFKNSVNDKLVNYTFRFKNSYNEINNI